MHGPALALLCPVRALRQYVDRTLEPRVGQPPAHSLGFKTYVSNQFPPVFSPQTGSGTESSGSESACGVLTPNSPESSLTRQTLSSPPPLRQAFKPINS